MEDADVALPHDNPRHADWHRDQAVVTADGLRAREAEELTVGLGQEHNLFILAAPIYVRSSPI